MIETTEHLLSSGPIDRPHYAATTTGNTDDAEHKRLMRQWYGLSPKRGYSWRGWASARITWPGSDAPPATASAPGISSDTGRCGTTPRPGAMPTASR